MAAIAAGVGTPTKLLSWKQSPWNNLLLAPCGPFVDTYQRNSWETWDLSFEKLARDLDLKQQLCGPLIEGERLNAEETVFDQVEQKLGVLNDPITDRQKSETDDSGILGELKLDQALKLAKKKIKDGDYDEAKVIYEDILKKFSKNKKALDGLRSLSDKPDTKRPTIQEPPQNQMQAVFDLYIQGRHQDALDQTLELLSGVSATLSLYTTYLELQIRIRQVRSSNRGLPKKHFQSILIVMMPISNMAY